jgi:NADH-quinone oxidoreductase subunit L
MGEFFDFQEHPGHLYVVATLLPIVAFLLILLGKAVRTALWSYRNAGGVCESLYRTLGGDKPSPVAAYLATAAIGGAFILSLIGFIFFSQDHAEHAGHAAAAHQHDHKDKAKQEEPEEEKEAAHAHNKWADSVTWASVGPAAVGVSGPGTTLRVGYYIDSLAAIMFLMVTFIATLIHLFSMGYMHEELEPVVADHQVHTEHGHLHRRGRYGRFFMFLALFCFSMLNLILADNLFQVFVSWELVGICSYLLIGFYFERQSAANAANKAFITNRVGDAGFVIGLLIVWTYVGSFNFQEIFSRVRAPVADAHGEPMELAAQFVRGEPSADGKKLTIAQGSGSQVVLFPLESHLHAEGWTAQRKDPQNADKMVPREVSTTGRGFGTIPYWLLVAAGLGIFTGCVGKSAHFPLQVWLPDAMEGPTPVSALIHAATMVAAGVYLVGRAFPLFTTEVLLTIAYTGAITLFVAATIALVMTDIKKVLAYSTVSQLGYMMLALGVGGWVAGLFHLVTHAFFKALLFLGSGSVIYGCHHEQEMTRMGGLYPKMKITALTMLMGVLAISGTFLFSGWYSKDAILAQAIGFVLVPENRHHFLLFLLPLITAGITTFYMFRMWYLTFTGRPRDAHVHEHAHESPWVMTVPLIVLAFFSVVVAWGWPPWDPEQSYLEDQIHHSMPAAVLADFGGLAELGEMWEGGPFQHAETSVRGLGHTHHGLAGGLAMVIVIAAFAFATLVYYRGVLDPAEAKAQFPAVYRFLEHKWYFDEAYSVLLVRPALRIAGWCRWFDTYVIDGLVHWLARSAVWLSSESGRNDRYVVDGLANLLARVCFGIGNGLRRVQTGYIRSYVLFLVLAAVGIWAILSYFLGPPPAPAR